MLTNLSSICVLEYLSFEKRQNIASQIPGFRKVEKAIPLHLNHLAISADRIRIDEYEYFLSRRYRNYRNKNSLVSWTIEFRKRRIQDASIENTVLRVLFPLFQSIQKLFDKLVFHLIGNRPMIHTNKLEFGDLWKCSFPAGLKIQAKIMETRSFMFSYEDLIRISTYLGPKPLKEFSTHFYTYPILTHSIVRNSQKLVLWRYLVNFDHQQVNHRNIHLKDYDRRTLIDLMNAWIASGPEVGMEFSGDIKVSKNSTLEEISMKEIMYLKKCESNGRRVKADKRFPNTIYSISMPRTNNPDTEIQFSLIENESNDPRFQVHLKIQPSGTAIPERFDSMYWELKLWEIRKIFKTG
ncbi:unnamed protein product [Caenorhabditis nigoni]